MPWGRLGGGGVGVMVTLGIDWYIKDQLFWNHDQMLGSSKSQSKWINLQMSITVEVRPVQNLQVFLFTFLHRQDKM